MSQFCTKFESDILFFAQKMQFGFTINVISENKELLFNPSLNEFEDVLFGIYDYIGKSFMTIKSFDTKLMHNFENIVSNQYINVLIPADITESNKFEMSQYLNEQRKYPENLLKDFDPYIGLINGDVSIENRSRNIYFKMTFLTG